MAATIDMYAPCPCGSGKKVKFCCRDLVQEFERIDQMIQGGQRKACLEHVERLLQKHPSNSFLRSLQIELNYALERFDQGDALIQQWVKQEPENPVPLGWSVISLLSQVGEEEDEQEAAKLFRMALLWLQRALHHSEEKVPPLVERAALLVGQVAEEREWFLPLIGHVLVGSRLSREGQREMGSRFLGLIIHQDIPLVVRMLLLFIRPDEELRGVAFVWEEVLPLLRQGRFQQAEEQLAGAVQQHPEDERAWYCLGVVRGFLADNRRAVEALQRAAQLASCPLRRAEILALCLVVQGIFQQGYEFLGVEIPVEDADQVLETLQGISLLRSIGTVPMGFDLQQMAEDPETALQDYSSQPPPQAAFQLADVELASDTPGVHRLGWGTVLLYGKQTDRPARLQVMGSRWHPEDAPLGWEELARELPQFRWQEHPLHVLAKHPFHTWFTQFEAQTPADEDASEVAQWFWKRLLHWSRTHRLPQLGHRTLAQAAQDPEALPQVEALLLLLENLGGEKAFLLVDLDQFRRELGLEVPEPIRLTDVEELRRLSPCWYHRLATDDGFTPEMWELALPTVNMLHFQRAQRVLAQACYDSGLWKQHPRMALDVATALNVVEPDPEQLWSRVASMHEHHRHQEAFSEDLCAEWDVQLLKVQLRLGPEKFREALQLADHMLRQHRNHAPAVALASQVLNLAQQIMAAGMDPEQLASQAAREEPVSKPSGLWTPDQGPPTPAPSSQKLWTPD